MLLHMAEAEVKQASSAVSQTSSDPNYLPKAPYSSVIMGVEFQHNLGKDTNIQSIAGTEKTLHLTKL